MRSIRSRGAALIVVAVTALSAAAAVRAVVASATRHRARGEADAVARAFG